MKNTIITIILLSILIFGIVLVTIDYSKKNKSCPSVEQDNKEENNDNLEYIIDTMFNQPTPWVGRFEKNKK